MNYNCVLASALTLNARKSDSIRTFVLFTSRK